jgi:hypothetical protein
VKNNCEEYLIGAGGVVQACYGGSLAWAVTAGWVSGGLA